jgi:hypothetical protein
MTINRHLMGVVVATLAAMAAPACLVDDMADTDEVEEIGETEQAASASFLYSCWGASYTPGNNHEIVFAWWSGCWRRNGTRAEGGTWEGHCYVDLNNCDGHVQCGGSCP